MPATHHPIRAEGKHHRGQQANSYAEKASISTEAVHPTAYGLGFGGDAPVDFDGG
jgi:hypothetical protein